MNENLLNLYKLLSDILKVDINKINEETSPRNTESWDSFNGLMIASELEKQFNINFDIEDIVGIKKTEDIIKILRKYKVNI